MSASDWLAWLEAHPEIESVRAAVCDLNGVMRGKRLPASGAAKALAGELRMPLSAAGVDVWGADVADNTLVYEAGDADGRAVWTGRAPLPVDWLERPTALIPLWFEDEAGAPFGGDPRRALAAEAGRWQALSLTPVVAMELEFYLVDPGDGRPLGPRSPLTRRRLDTVDVYSLDAIDQFEGFVADVYRTCAAQDVPADVAIAENGAGQFEINLRHVADPLKAADDAMYFKRIVKGVARRHGFAATFMAKPYGDRSGSGLHVHLSVTGADGANAFDDGGEAGTATLHHAVGGLVAAMAESTLVFAPHLNSYRRLRPGTHAPTGIGWGYENRTAAIRIPGGPAEARRIEHRVAGADANPYLVLAALLGAARHGIEARVPAPEPVAGNAYDAALEQLPRDWTAALDAFERGAILPGTFAPILRTLLAAAKRQEMAVFAGEISEFEIRTYLDAV